MASVQRARYEKKRNRVKQRKKKKATERETRKEEPRGEDGDSNESKFAGIPIWTLRTLAALHAFCCFYWVTRREIIRLKCLAQSFLNLHLYAFLGLT